MQPRVTRQGFVRRVRWQSITGSSGRPYRRPCDRLEACEEEVTFETPELAILEGVSNRLTPEELALLAKQLAGAECGGGSAHQGASHPRLLRNLRLLRAYDAKRHRQLAPKVRRQNVPPAQRVRLRQRVFPCSRSIELLLTGTRGTFEAWRHRSRAFPGVADSRNKLSRQLASPGSLGVSTSRGWYASVKGLDGKMCEFVYFFGRVTFPRRKAL